MTPSPAHTEMRTFMLCDETRSSAQGKCSAKSLAGKVTDSSISFFLVFHRGGPRVGGVLGLGGLGVGGGLGEGGGVKGGGGRGHFIYLAIYCTTTWCFAREGLRTIKGCWARRAAVVVVRSIISASRSQRASISPGLGTAR